MKVKVVLYSMLRERYARESKGRQEVELPGGSSIANLLDNIGIDTDSIAVRCSMNNEIERDFSRVLQDGDEVHFFRPIGGGQIKEGR